MTMQEFFSLVPLIGSAIGTLVAGGWWAYKKIIKPVRAWGREMSTAASNVKSQTGQIDALTSRVECIQKELQYNGGGSLRDMVSEIHSRVVMSQEFDRALADSLPYAIWHADAQGQFIWTNRMWEKFTGMPPERTKGKGWILGVHSEDRDEMVTEWFRASRDGREFMMSFRFRDEEGNVTPVYGQAFVMKNERGEALGYVGSAVLVQENNSDPS